mgnify:CR=1 FL=1
MESGKVGEEPSTPEAPDASDGKAEKEGEADGKTKLDEHDRDRSGVRKQTIGCPNCCWNLTDARLSLVVQSRNVGKIRWADHTEGTVKQSNKSWQQSRLSV